MEKKYFYILIILAVLQTYFSYTQHREIIKNQKK